MEAISQAASEITAAMPNGGVDVRLDGRDLGFVVDAGHPGGDSATAPPAPPLPPSPPREEDEGVARVSLRLPESLKNRADDAAARAGQSLNTWLVNLIRAGTSEQAVQVDLDVSSLPFGGDFPFGGKRGNRRMTGWL